jgi:hypothetical protein
MGGVVGNRNGTRADFVSFNAVMFKRVVLFNTREREQFTEDCKELSYKKLAEVAGISEDALHKNLSRGRISYYSLDAMACYMGYHPLEFMV